MTRNMLDAIEAGRFHDGVWVSNLLHRFADYYFAALDLYEQASQATPPVWKLAFDATRDAERDHAAAFVAGRQRAHQFRSGVLAVRSTCAGMGRAAHAEQRARATPITNWSIASSAKRPMPCKIKLSSVLAVVQS